MKFAVDLHIHTALSPCGDEDMTPNNIVNMALLKGLDIIAITDHNSCGNLEAVAEAARNNGLTVVPGIEVQSREEVHLICLFKKIDIAKEFGQIIYDSLPDIQNKEEFFGRQLLINSKDEVVGKLDKLLLSSCSYSVEEIFALAARYDGLCIPAHVDKSAYSIISNLGFIPDSLNVAAVELSKKESVEGILKRIPFLGRFKHIISSDAHYLWDISEREFFVDLEYLSISQLFASLRKP